MVGKIPQQVLTVLQSLERAGFEAFIVGGCVRDLLMKKIPLDWDLATNALPEDVQKIFPDSFYENNFGTVGIKSTNDKQQMPRGKSGLEKSTPTVNDQSSVASQIIEVTTYRAEKGYSDKRRPDFVTFVKTIEEDLQRRDFTINAMALRVESGKSKVKNALIDLFDGQKDLEKKVIRAVGTPSERFSEDALRMMRAVR